jgi:hypothetical protein
MGLPSVLLVGHLKENGLIIAKGEIKANEKIWC